MRRAPVAWSTISLLAALIIPLAASAQSEPAKRVLVVHSFGSAAPPFSVHSMAFESELVGKLGERIDLDDVSLDMARYADPEMQDAIVEYLEKRQLKWRPDLVVPIGSPAGVFVAKYRERLFPQTPILYTSLDRRLLPPRALENNAAYIGQVFELPGLIEDMLQIAPATKNVAVVVGITPLEKYWKQAFQNAAAGWSDKIKFTYYDDLSFDQMLEKAKTLPPDSYVFLLLLLRDAAGITHNADEALQRLNAVTKAPINSIFDHQLGLGIVGGRLYQSERVGRDAAAIAVRILHGEPAASFEPKLVERLPPRYDWRELHRWKIDPKRLPAGSTILHRAPTAWEQYREWILLAASIGVAQALLIVALLANLIWRRRAERSLSESEARFRNMADMAPVLIWMAGPDRLCTFFNKVWLAFTGRSLEQELGDGWADGVHPDDLKGCLAAYSEAFDKRQPFIMQYRLRRHDGVYRTVTDERLPRYDAAGGFLGYIGACFDITDQLEQQKALHEIKERVALATEAARLGVWEFDPATKELWVSDKVRELFQFKADGAVSYEEFQERLHPEDRPRRHAATQHALETKGGYELDYRIVLPNGTLRWIAGRGRCIENGHAGSLRLLGVAMDVTERKLAEEEAKRSREQVDLLSRASLLGEMTASLAHELNQPLSAIMSNANAGIRFIDKGELNEDELREILDDVSGDARRAHEIIRSVRSAIKKGTALRGPININDLVTSVVHTLQPEATVQFCRIETKLGDQLPSVDGDPTQLQQVLVNLVRNAFEAMRDTPLPARNVEIATGLNGEGTVAIAVRDHGTGFLNGTQERLFEHFFTTKDEGLGMGLSIVRSIIEAHGGKIAAENVDGGARFYFHLPASVVEPA